MSEKIQFRAESRRLLDLMIHSIYTNKDIFLRELISNASDAIEKLQYLALTDPSAGREDHAILLRLDKDQRLLTVEDTGIGMSEEELKNNLGVIAASGSERFRRELEQAEDAASLIGQFGVGFYSAFMVADHIRVVSRRHGETTAHCWESEGVEDYTITPCEKASAGTEITLHIREDGEEADVFSRYLREYTLWKLVKTHSDYIRYPIRLMMPRPVPKVGSTPEAPEFEERWEYETINSMIPLWQKKRSEVTKQEQIDFYLSHFPDKRAPCCVISADVEGTVSYRALLFIPSGKPLSPEAAKPGLQLYSSGVKIMDFCDSILPDYLSFVRGVVDSPDLSLNISRELLQHDRQLKLIGSSLEKKLRAELDRLLKNDRESYVQFHEAFGRTIKLCMIDNYGEKKERLKDYLMFYSSTEEAYVTFAEYVSRMKPEQDAIYYAFGTSHEAIDRLPHLEGLKEQGVEILYFTDKADEFVPDVLKEYGGKPFRSAVDGTAPSAGNSAKKYEPLLRFIKDVLGSEVDEVIVSGKLRSHPVCVSSGTGITFEMERYYKASRPERGVRAKRILEINAEHSALQALDRQRLMNPEKARKYAKILLTQALMIAGMPVEDPTEYTDLICSLW